MFDKNKVKLGIAPIAWTNDDLPDLGAENTFEQCVSEMALAGFTGSEVGNKYPKDPAELKKALELDLSVIVCVNKVDRPEARPDEVVDETLELLMELDKALDLR